MDPRPISINGNNLWNNDVRLLSAEGYSLWGTTEAEEPSGIITIGVCDPIGYGFELGALGVNSDAFLVNFSASYLKPTMRASEIEE